MPASLLFWQPLAPAPDGLEADFFFIPAAAGCLQPGSLVTDRAQ
jgi:hypothetical protein